MNTQKKLQKGWVNMIRCKAFSCDLYSGCCCDCPHEETCAESCTNEPIKCGYSYEEAEGETAIAVFQSKAIGIIKSIAELDSKKKYLEMQDAELRRKLQEAMDAHGIRSFENDLLKISYVEPTTKASIDSKKLKAELPEIAEKYTKISPVKGYVKIVVK